MQGKRKSKMRVRGFLSGFFSALVLCVGFKDYIFVLLEPQKLLTGAHASGVEQGASTGRDPSSVLKEEMKASSFSDSQRLEIENIVVDLMKNKPELISKAFEQGVQFQQQKAISSLEEGVGREFDLLKEGGIHFGNEKSLNHFVAFIDPLCNHCQAFSRTLLEMKKKNVDLCFSLYPIAFLDEKSAILARYLFVAAQHSVEQMLMLSASFSAFQKQEDINLESINRICKSVGLNPDAMASASSSDEVMATIEVYSKKAEHLKLPGVPAIFAQHVDKKVSMFMPGTLDIFIKNVDYIKLAKQEYSELQRKSLEERFALEESLQPPSSLPSKPLQGECLIPDEGKRSLQKK